MNGNSADLSSSFSNRLGRRLVCIPIPVYCAQYCVDVFVKHNLLSNGTRILNAATTTTVSVQAVSIPYIRIPLFASTTATAQENRECFLVQPRMTK
jgi:hypothetical protein